MKLFKRGGSDSKVNTPQQTSSPQKDEHEVSHVWRVCAKTLNTSLEEEGLFRIEGDSNEVARILKTLQQGGKADLSRCSSIHVVASVLKRDIRERQKPLFPIKFYVQVVSSQASPTQSVRVSTLKNVLYRFPIANLKDLQFIFNLLNRVAQHSAANKMSAENLAKVFAPTLMRAHDPKLEQQNLPQQIEAVRLLIEKPDLITKAIKEAKSGTATTEEAQIGMDGREILHMVLGVDSLQFTEGSWHRETGKGVVLSDQQLEHENRVLEAENQLLALENEELIAMLAASRNGMQKIERELSRKEGKSRR